MFDLVIKNGVLLDPSQNINEKFDIAFSDGRVESIESEISSKDTQELYDAGGCIITPGFVDLHTHLFWGVSHYGAQPDATCLPKGVTTAVDAGSAGALNYQGFEEYVIKQSQTRILAFLHISSIGLSGHPDIGELMDFRYLDYQRAIKTARKYSNTIYGIKIRLSENLVGELGPQALALAKEAAKEMELPLMVHPGRLPKNLPLVDVLTTLGEGDILTHCLPPPYPPTWTNSSIFNENDELLDEVWDAQERGIIFDVGHGRGSFSFKTAENALEQGFHPNVISTDLHTYSLIHPVYDMPTTISKFYNIGIPLGKAIELSTTSPSRVLGIEGDLGTLKEGAIGDAVIIKVEKGGHDFWDSIDVKRNWEETIKTKAVVHSGKLLNNN
jgi:dihydroorotase